MDYKLLIYHFLMCLLDTGKVILALQYIIGMKERKMPWQRAINIVFVFVTMLLSCLFIPEEYIAIMYIPVILIVMEIRLGIGNIRRFLLAVISYVCICELDYFASAVARALPQAGVVMKKQQLLCSTACYLVILLAAIACKKYDISFYKKNYGKKKVFVAIEVFVLFVNFAVMGSFFAVLGNEYTHGFGRILLLLVITLSMFLSIITLIYYSSIMNVQEYKTLNAMNQQYLRVQKKHYDSLRLVDRDTRKFRHDTKNHMTVLQTMIEKGEQDQALNYIHEITNKMEPMSCIMRTGSDIADSIVNYKKIRCDEKNIKLEVDGILYAPLKMNDFDFCTILANALDNAIEATEKVTEKERKISVRLDIFNKFLHIIISNPMQEPLRTKSCKKDKRNHGFGLENMQQAVDRNFGQIKIDEIDGNFVLDVVVKAFE